MSRTLSGTYTAGITLTAAADNPTTIAATAEVYGGIAVSSATAWQIVDEGSIQRTAIGISLSAGGTVASSGLISAATVGVLIAGGTGSIMNTGAILSAGDAVYLRAGGSVTNQAAGTITGYTGIYGSGQSLTVVNAGSIAGSPTGLIGDGIVLLAGGGVTNLTAGTISGYDAVYAKYDAASVVNAGRIMAFGSYGIGVYLRAGGGITNQAGGSISGFDALICDDAGMTVVNAGRISGADFAVRFAAGYASRAVIDPGAMFVGTVAGGNLPGAGVSSTLELASAAIAGTLSGIGEQFLDFAQTTIDAGASWTLAGTNYFAGGTTLTNAGTLTLLNVLLPGAGNVVNQGGIRISSAEITLAGITGTGSVAIGVGDTLDVLGLIGAGQTIMFDPGGGGLLGANPTAFSGQIDGFGVGDTIGLSGVTDGFAPAIVNGNTLEVQRTADPPVDLTLDPTVDYTDDSFAISPDGAVTEAVPCFLRDTVIRCERGDVPVQDLIVGDRVVTWSGAIRPIIWIGTGRMAQPPGRRTAATPIVVRRNALADDVPCDDLHITKGHSLLLDEVLIPAEFLVNHRSIFWDDQVCHAAFYHIELQSHDVLVANGAPAESYRDDDNRWLFQNANSGWTRPPMPPCAAVLTGGAVVDAIWRRLLDRAGPPAAATLTDDPDVHLRVGGARLDATTRTGDVLIFNVSRVQAGIHIVSLAAAPQALGLARDPRRLGVALSRIVVRQRSRFRVIEMADKRLRDGFHSFEAGLDLRWTDGDATLPASLFEGFAGPVELVLHLGGSTRYPMAALAA